MKSFKDGVRWARNAVADGLGITSQAGRGSSNLYPLIAAVIEAKSRIEAANIVVTQTPLTGKE